MAKRQGGQRAQPCIAAISADVPREAGDRRVSFVLPARKKREAREGSNDFHKALWGKSPYDALTDEGGLKVALAKWAVDNKEHLRPWRHFLNIDDHAESDFAKSPADRSNRSKEPVAVLGPQSPILKDPRPEDLPDLSGDLARSFLE